MTKKHTPTSPAKLDPKEARAGKPVKGMPVVLGVSILAVVIIFAVVLAIFL